MSIYGSRTTPLIKVPIAALAAMDVRFAQWESDKLFDAIANYASADDPRLDDLRFVQAADVGEWHATATLATMVMAMRDDGYCQAAAIEAALICCEAIAKSIRASRQ